MQGQKTRDDVPHFDLFECLSCHTTISEQKTATGEGPVH
jgi:hypothetical protein